MDPIITDSYIRFEPMHQNEKPISTVLERPERRRFTKEDKLRILRLADACTVHGQLGALLRREGIYASHIISFRRQRAEGRLDSSVPLSRKDSALITENGRLRLALEKTARKLEQAELIIEVQKKVSQILELSTMNNQDLQSIQNNLNRK